MRHTARLFVTGLLAVLLASAAEADAAQERAARALAETLVEDTHSAMTARDLDQAARNDRLTKAIADAFAFDVWERFLVGDRELTEAERKEFRNLLPGFLAQLYAEQFGKGLQQQPEIRGARAVRRDVLVEAAIPRASGKPLPVEYRIRDFEDRGPQVIDVMVGGVSFLLLKRDEFGGLIEREGVDGLLAFMRENSI